MLLVLVAGAAGLALEGSMLTRPGHFALFIVGLFLTGGCANALNQYFERNIDAKMTRTAGRRPLPRKQVSPAVALVFSIAIGVAGVTLFATVFNLITAVIALGVILFYGLVYTLWLKPNTSQNIVIGGIAGAMAPVGAWTAATGHTAFMPWIICLLIFFWTPPHFWALAIRFRDDYHKARLPMLPLVKGDAATLGQIFYYTLITVAVSLLPMAAGAGWLYAMVAAALGWVFIRRAHLARKTRRPEHVWSIFRFSITYLFVILIALVVDNLVL
jgi:protoheme IX farnesyltransferase